MKLTSYLWFAPFFCFCAGYYAMSMLCTVKTVETPCLVGKSLHEALNLLSSVNLNGKIVREKIDPDLPEGTIISQIPTTGTRIKINQSVYVGIVKKPSAKKVPNLLGKGKADIEELLASLSLKAHYYLIPGLGKGGACSAQHPMAQKPLDGQEIVVYLCDTAPKPVIMPTLTGHTISEVKEFFAPYQIDLEVLHLNNTPHDHTCENCSIIDQRPLAGSLISFLQGKKLILQVKVDTPGNI